MKTPIKTIFTLFTLLACIVAHAESANEFTRRNAASPEAKADLEALSDALKKMKAMGCDSPFSWYYQGATHSIPNEVKNNKLCPSYQTINDLKWGWATCTHKKGSDIHFLIWHRIYIAHFEKIVRKLSGKKDFALPYWNYIDPNNRIMPAPFTNSDSSLYASARLPGLNTGKPIESFMDQYLDVSNLMNNKVFAVFSSNIDAAPHGAMHVYIGGGYAGKKMPNPIYQNNDNFGLMTQVESAGFDPIFWLHHSNIDFIWQSWENGPNGRRPSLAELEAAPWPYKFYDENGEKVEYTVAEAYQAAFNPDYQYDQLQMHQTKLVASTEHEALVAKHVRQSKKLLWTKKMSKSTKNKILILTPEVLSSHKNMELMLTNQPEALVIEIEVSFDKEPKEAYSVYIMDEKENKTLIGVMTFFGAAHHMNMQGHEEHAMKIKKKFSYDVTADFPQNENYKIVIESQFNKGEAITVENMSLYRY